MSEHPLVVIGASAGGLQALQEVLSSLPDDLAACVLVVMHTPSNGSGVLPQILSRFTRLRVAFGRTGDPLEPARVYVARPDFHLIVTSDGLQVVHGPRENGFRPAIDPLFRTAGREFGARVIGVVLSGALADGTFGLSVIKHFGGIAIVQEPTDAIIPAMPLNAIKSVDVDHVAPARDIGAIIERLTSVVEARPGAVDMPRRKQELEPQLSPDTTVTEMQDLFGPPSALTCPECGGAMWEVQENRVLRYQCHTGHQYAPENLEEGQRDAIDGALWSAVRVLEEHAALKTRMAERAAGSGLTAVAEGFAEGARDAHEQAQRIRAVLFDLGNGGKGNGRKGNGGIGNGDGGVPRSSVTANRARKKSDGRGTSAGRRSTPRRSRR
jgi:two-component system chemotaxis response regulator CheB